MVYDKMVFRRWKINSKLKLYNDYRVFGKFADTSTLPRAFVSISSARSEFSIAILDCRREKLSSVAFDNNFVSRDALRGVCSQHNMQLRSALDLEHFQWQGVDGGDGGGGDGRGKERDTNYPVEPSY